MILQGRVRVDGAIVTTLGTQIDPARNVVSVDGRTVRVQPSQWIAMHKPAGYLTTRKDARGRKTVYDLLPEHWTGLGYVGRLDFPSEGLLLFTNEGEVAQRLLLPETGVEREYRVWVRGAPSRKALDRMKRGITLDEGVVRAADVGFIRTVRDRTLLKIVLTEGKKREIRRMCDIIRHPVERLIRIRFGPIYLGEMEPGEVRELSDREVEEIEEAARPKRRSRHR